jgi:1,2-dihydroxy-3-keto-5-methylthiopentene dioxygenase
MKKILLSLSSLFSIASASQLEVYDDQKVALLQQTSDQKEIAACLNVIGVRFEQWEAAHPLTPSSSGEEIQEAYRADINRLKEENGFQSVDVLRMSPDHPKKEELRQKFLNEHTHDEPEVRFFVEGSGLFFLHVDGRVYSVLCEKGDLISIPQNYRHWFDMGTEPLFTAIRFFTRTEGWVAHFTGDPISQGFVN